MALKNEPTAPYHSAQDALRVLETVARHTTGVTGAELARHTG
ncbi:IclR family transcriptional regulator, partial [Streptomyces sp. NPDC127574]